MPARRFESTQIKAQSQKERAYDALRTAIATTDVYGSKGSLRLDERELAKRFGVSRTPLREALGQLEMEGVIEIVPWRGNFVVRKSKAEILEILMVWAALESMAARILAETASESAIRELNNLANPQLTSAACRSMSERLTVDFEFHRTLIEHSGQALIATVAEGLFFHLRAVLSLAETELETLERHCGEYTRIVAAIARRDADTAARLVRDHTLNLRHHISQFVDLI